MSAAPSAYRLSPEVRAAIARALPRAAPSRARVIGEGWGSVAYRVPDPGGDWAVRVRRAASFEQVTGDLEREVALLPLLESRGLPTPRAARALRGPRGALLGVAHRLVEGEPATRARLGRGRRRAALAAALGDFLTRLHAVPPAHARAAGVPSLDLWRDRFRGLIAECAPLLGPRSRAWLESTTKRFLAEGGMAGAPRVLVHGDIAAAHLLLDRDGAVAGVIDFGDAMVADPALDFGGLLLAYGWPFTEQVLGAYGGLVDPHLRRRARFYVDVVPLFLVQFGRLFGEGEHRAGLRQFAARAAAAERAGGPRV